MMAGRMLVIIPRHVVITVVATVAVAATTAIVCWGHVTPRLLFKLIEVVATEWRDHWDLWVYFFLWEFVHYSAVGLIGAAGDHGKALWLTVDLILVEFDFYEVGDAQASDYVVEVLVCCPPCQVANVARNSFDIATFIFLGK